MAGPEAQRRTFAFTFGLERLGLVALARPYVTLGLIILLSALAALSLINIKVDDSLSELFRTDTREFRQYEEIDRRFPSSEYDVLLVVEGKDLLAKPQIRAFQTMVVDLQLADGLDGLVSMLSARGKPDAKGYAAPIIPDNLPDGPEYDALIKQLRENDIVAGKFLSADGQLGLVVVALDRAAVAERGLKQVVTDLQTAAEKALQGSGLTVKLTGAPVMQLEIRNAVERDRLIYNGLGFILGALLAYIFFRRISLTIIAVLGPVIAILWTLGLVSFLDYRLNLFINVLTPLILVSGFSDSMHLVFSIRRDILAGVDRLTAARNAVLDVAPACLLTAMNAALALISFSWAESALIRTFGKSALLAVAVSYIAVAVVVPTLAAILIRGPARQGLDEPRAAPDVEDSSGPLGQVTERIVRQVVRAPMPILLVSIVTVALLGVAYASLVPQYRLADQVPDKEQALAATGRIDQKLTGANPVHVMIQWPSKPGPDGRPAPKLFDPQTIKVIAEAHAVLEKSAGLGNVWSIESLRRWLAEAGDTRIETVQRYVGVLPQHLVRRFIDKDGSAVLVTGRLPDVDSSQILPVVEKVDKALDAVRQANPGYDISVTGLPAIAARNSAKLIGELNWGLVGDMFIIFIFLGIALRSVLSGVSSVLPSLFPIFATGALLWVIGEGLQFASIIAITVAFSLAIDSTIHFLNRFQLEERRIGPGQASQALIATIHHIGPAVIMTTCVLALGLGVTMFSHLPSLRLFGRLTAVCLFSSLVAQLIILPATIAVFRRFFPYRG